MRKSVKIGVGLALIGSTLAGCDSAPKPIDSIANTTAGVSRLGALSNSILQASGIVFQDGMLKYPKGMKINATEIVPPQNFPSNSAWEKVTATINGPGTGAPVQGPDTCTFTFTARENANGSFGGEVIGPDQAFGVTHVALKSMLYGESIDFTTERTGVYGDGHAALEDNLSGANGTTYTVSPSGNEKQLTESVVDDATPVIQALVNSCFQSA